MNARKRLLFAAVFACLPTCLFAPRENVAGAYHQFSPLPSSAPEASKTEALVQQLLAAETINQRQTLITENQHLLSSQLIESLLEKANAVPVDRLDPDEKLGKYESLNHLALGLSQRISFPAGSATAINNLGAVKRKRKQFDLALAYHNRSLSLFRGLEQKSGMEQASRRGTAQAYRFLARVHFEQQNHPEALKYYLEDLRLAKLSGDQYAIARALYNVGVANEEMEQLSVAIKHYSDSLSLSQNITPTPQTAGLPDVITGALRRSGRSHFALRQFDQAINSYQHAAEIYRQAGDAGGLAATLTAIGHVSLEAGNYPHAMEAYGRSLQAARQEDYRSAATNHLEMALVHTALKAYPQAFDALEKARLAAAKIKNASPLLNLYRAEGIANYAANRPQQAREALDKAIKIIERSRMRIPTNVDAGPVSLGYQYSPYGWMTALLVSQDQLEEALHYAERSKSRFLFGLLGDSTGKTSQIAAPSNLLEQERLVGRHLDLEMQISQEEYGAHADAAKPAALRTQLQAVNHALVEIKSRIDADLTAAAERWPKESKLTRQDLASLLPDERTALLQFVMSEEQAFLFAATKTGNTTRLSAYPLKLKRSEIKSGVERFRNFIANQHQGRDLSLMAREWHDKLLGQAQQQLEGITSLIIVPDGPLWELPFQALKTADDRYLIERCAISYAPSFNILRKMQQQPARSAAELKLLAFGNPSLSAKPGLPASVSFMDSSLKPLPEAEKQVAQISKHYDSQGSKVLTRSLATEASFKTLAPNYRILHLAAHGLYNDVDPMRSSIVLSQIRKTAEEDGFLEARELANLNLKAELAILSACETGRGQVRDGEGIIGLPYALFAAGCPTTIVSQWKVRSQSTSDLMVALHDKLNQSPQRLSKAEALRQAALSLIHNPKADFRHPALWAGFIVFGKAD